MNHLLLQIFKDKKYQEIEHKKVTLENLWEFFSREIYRYIQIALEEGMNIRDILETAEWVIEDGEN